MSDVLNDRSSLFCHFWCWSLPLEEPMRWRQRRVSSLVMPTQWLQFGRCTLEKGWHSLLRQKSSSWSGWGIPGEIESGMVPGVTSKYWQSSIKGTKLCLGPPEAGHIIKHKDIMTASQNPVRSEMFCHLFPFCEHTQEQPGGYKFLNLCIHCSSGPLDLE